MPVANSVQNEVLKLYVIDNLTIKDIADTRNISVQAVYKTIKKLKQKGLIKGFNSKLKEGTTHAGGGFKGTYYRLHGLQYDIKILHQSETFSFAVTKGNSIRLLNNTIIFYKDKLEIYQDKESSFTGNTIEQCFEKAVSYFNDIIYKIEARYNISIVKEGYHNISIVNGHLAEVNNGIAKELYLSKEYITIYGKDGKAWFKIDYSKKQFKEAETVHPRDFKRDAQIVFGKYLGDWRDNPDSMTNSELTNTIKNQASVMQSVIDNQVMFAKNIELHMNVLKDMQLTLKEIRDTLHSPLDTLKSNITKVDDVFKYKEIVKTLDKREIKELEEHLFRI